MYTGGSARTRPFMCTLTAMNRRAFGINLLGLLGSVSCNSAPPLTNTRESPVVLARAVVDALLRRDRAALEGLALSEREFRDHVWPDLPASRPERNLPFSYVWGDLHQKSVNALSGTLARRGGRSYNVQRVTFAGVTDYPDARVHRGATFHVLEEAGGEGELRVCGSMYEKDSGWKVFSYVID